MNKANTGKQYRLVLINPYQRYRHYSTQFGLVKLMGKKNSMPSLALALVAALTPEHYDITIIDEEVESFVPEEISADIIGITSLSNTIDRTFDLADRFRSRGIKVVLGGPHITYMVQDGLAHADAIVVGEAELLWPALLRDFERGNLQPVYKTEDTVPFITSPKPRWDLMKTDRYISMPVQASRGCPFNCEFCLVTKIFGKKSRLRDVENVIEEIKALPMKRVFFIDDNLTINRAFAWKLMRGLKDLGISWICQASIDIADDTELLGAMAEAGCENILIGFESLNPESLRETHKFHNIHKDYTAAIQKIHAAGIHVYASFVVGFDNDTLETFDSIYDFSVRTSIPFTTINILGTSPGTDLEARLKKEGRLCAVPWEFSGGMFPCLKYRNMSHAALFNKYIDTLDRIYSFDTILTKARGLFGTGYFARQKKDLDIRFKEKMAISLRLVRLYVFTRDSAKRSLFLYLMMLVRQKKVAVERAIVFLLSMEGFRRVIDELQKLRPAFLEIIKTYEQ